MLPDGGVFAIMFVVLVSIDFFIARSLIPASVAAWCMYLSLSTLSLTPLSSSLEFICICSTAVSRSALFILSPFSASIPTGPFHSSYAACWAGVSVSGFCLPSFAFIASLFSSGVRLLSHAGTSGNCLCSSFPCAAVCDFSITFDMAASAACLCWPIGMPMSPAIIPCCSALSGCGIKSPPPKVGVGMFPWLAIPPLNSPVAPALIIPRTPAPWRLADTADAAAEVVVIAVTMVPVCIAEDTVWFAIWLTLPSIGTIITGRVIAKNTTPIDVIHT